MINLEAKERNLEDRPQDLRKKGFIPGIIYGNDIVGRPIQIQRKGLLKAKEMDGEVYTIKCGRRKFHTKVHNIQRDPVSHEPIHISLINLSKKEKTEVDIPIHFTGTPKGLKNGGVFVAIKKYLELKGKLKDMPESVEVDVSRLGIGDNIHVSEIKLNEEVLIKDNGGDVVAICRPPAKSDNEEVLDEARTEVIGTNNEQVMAR